MKKKVLVIVAHPDDELIWMGGTLLKNKKEWNTKVVCLTRESDKDRNPKFKKVMKALGVKGFIYNLDDENLHKPLTLESILSILKTHSKTKYDLIYTHNLNGEYGHPRHIETHKAVLFALKNKIIFAKKTIFFSYHKMENNFQGYALYNSNAEILIKLNNDQLSTKKHLIEKIYGYQKNGFEEKSCGKIEAFDILKK